MIALKILFKFLDRGGIYIIEDYKYPNYYRYNKDVDDILIDKMLHKLKDKKKFSSKILIEKDQQYLINNITSINEHIGNSNSLIFVL